MMEISFDENSQDQENSQVGDGTEPEVIPLDSDDDENVNSTSESNQRVFEVDEDENITEVLKVMIIRELEAIHHPFLSVTKLLQFFAGNSYYDTSRAK